MQFIATMVAGRDMLELDVEQHLYQELIREIRNRRISEELFQMKLAGPYDDPQLVLVKMEEE